MIDISKFKHGDKVTCKIESKEITDAKLVIQGSDYYIVQDIRDGSKPKDSLGYKYGWIFYPSSSSCDVYDLKLVNGFSVGDILVNEYGEKVKVLAQVGEIYFLSQENDFESAHDNVFTIKDIQSGLRKFVEVEELTMEEVCKQLGKTVKIKK